MGGAIAVSASTAGVMIGDPAQGCPTNRLTSFGASVLSNDQFGVDMSGNTIFGSLRVTQSGGVDLLLIPSGTTGEPVISGTTLGGALSCDGNTPPPSDRGTPNQVVGARSGQCASRQF